MLPPPYPPFLTDNASLMPLRPCADLHLMGASHLMCAAWEARVLESRGSNRADTGLEG
jgi:hypothetical protein